MAVKGPKVIHGTVEGNVDEAVVKRLIRSVGAIPGPIHGKRGKGYIQKNIGNFNQAANYDLWFILVDLDEDECAPKVIHNWLPGQSKKLCFRIAVREVESWLLADNENIARFLSVRQTLISQEPDSIPNPKDYMVDLARKSRKRDIREDMVPRPDSGRTIGPAYTSRLIEFIYDSKSGWRPEKAAGKSESLQKALICLKKLVKNTI